MATQVIVKIVYTVETEKEGIQLGRDLAAHDFGLLPIAAPESPKVNIVVEPKPRMPGMRIR